MKILVTGSSGYLGQHIVHTLQSSGHLVTGFSRQEGEGVIQGDLKSSPPNQTMLEGFDVLIHNALVWNEDPATDVNLDDLKACVLLFKTAIEAGVQHIIFTSSAAVHRPFQTRISEDDALNPDSWYGASKLAAENFLILLAKDAGVKVTIFRPTLIVGQPLTGSIPQSSKARIIHWYELLRSGLEFEVSQAETRCYTPISDLARAYELALNLPHDVLKVLALDTNPISAATIVQWVSEMTGLKNRSKMIQGHSVSPNFATKKFQEVFGFSLNAETALKQTIRTIAD